MSCYITSHLIKLVLVLKCPFRTEILYTGLENSKLRTLLKRNEILKPVIVVCTKDSAIIKMVGRKSQAYKMVDTSP